MNSEKNPCALLDDITTDIPIYLTSEDFHSTWTNSKAIELAGITKETTVENRIIEMTEDGRFKGIFRDDASGLVASGCSDYETEEYKTAIEQYFKDSYKYGLAGGLDALSEVDSNSYTAYLQLEEEGKLPVYAGQAISSGEDNTFETAAETLGKIQALPEHERVKIKTLKIFMDGVVEGTTAALTEPYDKEAGLPAGYMGEPMWSQEELNKTVALADSMKIQVHVHAIGDMASKMRQTHLNMPQSSTVQ